MHKTSRHLLRTSGFYTQPLVFKRTFAGRLIDNDQNMMSVLKYFILK